MFTRMLSHICFSAAMLCRLSFYHFQIVFAHFKQSTIDISCHTPPLACAAHALINGDHHKLDNSRLTASSQLDGNHGPGRSRLHQSQNGDQSGGWVPQFSDDKQWIQVSHRIIVFTVNKPSRTEIQRGQTGLSVIYKSQQ